MITGLARSVLALAGGLAAGLGSRPARAQCGATATFSGAIHGALPPAACGATGGGLSLTDFQETTPASAPNGSGTFELSFNSTCVAPLYQALFSQEAIAATFDFGDAERKSSTLSLANARLTHVDVSSARAGAATTMRVTIGIASPRVTAATARAPTIHLAGSARNALPGAGGAQAWAARGVGRVSVHLVAKPSLDATVVASEPSLTVHAAVDAVTGMPTPNFQIAYRFTLVQAPRDVVSVTATRPAMTQTVVTYAGFGTATTGVTLWLKSARVASVTTAGPATSISIAATQLTITDIGSGRTASLP